MKSAALKKEVHEILQDQLPLQEQLLFGDELIIDLFAGGGGASQAILEALGREPDVAINHDEFAVAMHRKNHPSTRHHREDVFKRDPLKETGGRPVGLLHASPDCTDHSQAKGGQPRSREIRALSWAVHKWAGKVKPRCITLENVEQILHWAPLVAKRDKATGRVVKIDGTVAAPGERVRVQDQFLIPCKKRKGRNWQHFVEGLRRMGYAVQWRKLKASKYGAGTSRERLFMMARCDGRPIVWPKETHGTKKGQKPLVTAADSIDFSIECPSIFTRKRPLVAATCRRIAKGIDKFVLNCADPFIVPIANWSNETVHSVKEPLRTTTAWPRGGKDALVVPSIVPATHQGSDRLNDVEEPLPTVTGAHRGELMLVAPVLSKVNSHGWDRDGGPVNSVDAPFGTLIGKDSTALISATLIQSGFGERPGQSPRVPGLDKPIGTAVAGGIKHSVVTAHLQRQFGNSVGHEATEPLGATTAGGGGKSALVSAFLEQANTGPIGHDAREPVSTIMQIGVRQRLVTAHTVKFKGTCKDGQSVNDPLHTVAAGGTHHALVEYQLSPQAEEGALRVAAFLIRYYGEGGQWGELREPIATMTTRDRLALVTVTIQGTPYVIVDIGLRMLTPRELFRAQGFPDSYIIDRGIDEDGNEIVMTKTNQVRMVGNSVSPPPYAALLRANFRHEQKYRMAA